MADPLITSHHCSNSWPCLCAAEAGSAQRDGVCGGSRFSKDAVCPACAAVPRRVRRRVGHRRLALFEAVQTEIKIVMSVLRVLREPRSSAISEWQSDSMHSRRCRHVQ